MRVLHVIPRFGIGGAEVMLCDLMAAQRNHGLECSVFSLQRIGGSVEARVINDGFEFHSNNINVYSPVNIFYLIRHLLACKYDIIHAHLFPSQLWLSLAARALSLKSILVTTEHSTYNRRRKAMLRQLDYFMYNKYAGIACISKATANNFNEWLPCLAHRSAVIFNGINLRVFGEAHSARVDDLMNGVGPIIVCVGRLEPVKGQAVLIRSLVQMTSVRLLLIGKGHGHLELEKLAVEVGVAERVCFLGERADIPQILKAAKVYVQPSIWEGFGIATLEAMASGLPVIVSDVPGLRDLVGDAGLKFVAGDVNGLVLAIKRILDDEELASQLVMKGLAKSREYSIEKTARCYIEWYSSFLSKSISK